MRYFIVFVDEATRDKPGVSLRTRDEAVEATGHHLDQMLRYGVSDKCISGDDPGELGRSGKFLKMLAERGFWWGLYPPRTSQSYGIAENGPSRISSQHPGANC